MRNKGTKATNFAGPILIAIAIGLCGGILAIIFTWHRSYINAPVKAESTVFYYVQPHDLLLTGKTMIGHKMGSELFPAIVRVYGDHQKIDLPLGTNPRQGGYAIVLNGAFGISSRTLSSIENLVSENGYKKITKVSISAIADVNSAEWKNAKPLQF
jgi:hypothetical protein